MRWLATKTDAGCDINWRCTSAIWAIICSAWARSSGERSSRLGPPSISEALVAGRSLAPDRSTGTSPSGVHRLIGGSLSYRSGPIAGAAVGSYCAGVGWNRYRRRLTTERKRGFGSHPATSEQLHSSEPCARVATFSSLSGVSCSCMAVSKGLSGVYRRVSVGVGFRPAPATLCFWVRPKARHNWRHVLITMHREDLARMRSDRP